MSYITYLCRAAINGTIKHQDAPAICTVVQSNIPTEVCHLVVVVGLMHQWPGRFVIWRRGANQEQTILHITSPRWLMICSASQPITVTFWLHRGCPLGWTDTASALGRCNNLPTRKV